MRVETRIFEFYDKGYKNLSELAQAIGISVSQIYRVRKGTRRIDEKFIVGVTRAFPNHELNDLFYLAPESPRLSSAKAGHFGESSYREHRAFPIARDALE